VRFVDVEIPGILPLTTRLVTFNASMTVEDLYRLVSASKDANAEGAFWTDKAASSQESFDGFSTGCVSIPNIVSSWNVP
jgi:hypothetical protein